MGVTTTVVGASGFTGGELCRLLLAHPALELTAAGAHTSVGRPLPEVQPQLAGASELVLADVAEAAAVEVDVCFSCLPGGVLAEHLPAVRADVVIDLSADHRAAPGWVYSLPECDRAPLHDARRIANPGCYPTAALLALVPFFRDGIVDGPVAIDAISGTSGAGRAPEDRLLHSVVDGAVAAYGSVEHRHVAEIESGLRRFAGVEQVVSFTPHLVPMPRGLLVTARVPLRRELTDDEALAILVATYRAEPFVSVVQNWPSTKAVVGSNAAHVSARVDARARFLICSAAIDNLGKGAAGQAVQNANHVLGLAETTGLSSLGVWP